MAQELLVATERQTVAELTDALDKQAFDICVVMVAKFEEYTDSRLVLASYVFDRQRELKSYLDYQLTLRKLSLRDEVPSSLILRMDDPVILALAEFGAIDEPHGLSLGLQRLGNRYLEDGLLFRSRR